MSGARSRLLAALAAIALLAACAGPTAAAADARPEAAPDSLASAPADSGGTDDAADRPDATPAVPRAAARRALEPLVPALAAHPYRLDPGVRAYRDRLSVSPAFGFLGADHLFALRASYNPEGWLGYEASVAHAPAHSVHALLHTLSVVVRRPLAGRLQPFVSGGYGMMVIFPGPSVGATNLTRNTLALGGGCELYIRSDLALRADLRQATVFGPTRDRDGLIANSYSEGTIGLAFYRSIQP